MQSKGEEQFDVTLPSQVHHLTLLRANLYLTMFIALGVCCGIAANHLGGPEAVQPVVFVGFTIVTVVFLARTRVSVGVDGLMVRWLGWRRFLPYGNIVNAKLERRSFGAERQVGARLTLRESADVLLVGRLSDRNAIRAIVSSIESAKGGRRSPIAVVALHQGSSAFDEWLAGLLGASERMSFRALALGSEDFWEVLDDASQAAVHRAAAAVAVRTQLDSEGRKRLRQHARTTACVELGDVFNAVADGDDRKASMAIRLLVKRTTDGPE